MFFVRTGRTGGSTWAIVGRRYPPLHVPPVYLSFVNQATLNTEVISPMSPIPVKPKAAASTAPPANVASMNPDSFIAGGLMDDFNGTITKVRFVPWNYAGSLDHYVLGVAVTIQPDEDEGDEFVQTYSCGDLENFVPSNDGVNSVPLDKEGATDEELEGIYAMRVGKKEGLANNTNWATFIRALIDAKFPQEKMGAAVTFAEGVHGHFNRIPQKKRSGIVRQETTDDKGRQRSNDILVVTEITPVKGAPAKAAARPAAGKPAATKAPVKAAVEQEAEAADADGAFDELDTVLIPIVKAAAEKAGEAGAQKTTLTGAAMKNLPGNLKGKGVKRIADPAFLEAAGEFGGWAYDADSGTVYDIPAE